MLLFVTPNEPLLGGLQVRPDGVITSVMLDPVRPISLSEIEKARERVAGTVLRTPLVRLDAGPGAAEIYLKLENLQPTNAYKIRGATNAVARLSDEERACGVWTISAGNAGQGVAYAARAFGVPCSVVAIETAPQTKLDRMRALGASIVPVSYSEAWKAAEAHAFEGIDGTFIHPFDNSHFIAGHGTMGLEIVEDLPDVRTVICAIGGGGLITGVGSAVKALRRDVEIIGAEPETAAPYAYSLERGGPSEFPDWQATFVDGAGGQSVTERMWQRMRPIADRSIVVTLDETRQAMRIIADKARAVAEGAGALALAAAVTGKAGEGPIVCVVSGGNIDLKKFAELIAG
jgi:threonine dehydratase